MNYEFLTDTKSVFYGMSKAQYDHLLRHPLFDYLERRFSNLEIQLEHLNQIGLNTLKEVSPGITKYNKTEIYELLEAIDTKYPIDRDLWKMAQVALNENLIEVYRNDFRLTTKGDAFLREMKSDKIENVPVTEEVIINSFSSESKEVESELECSVLYTPSEYIFTLEQYDEQESDAVVNQNILGYLENHNYVEKSIKGRRTTEKGKRLLKKLRTQVYG